MLGTILDWLLYGHIAAGTLGLAAFWVPIFAKKGSVNHKRFGKVFVNAGYFVVASAVVGALINIGFALAADLSSERFHAIIGFRIFLLYLALIVGVQLYYGQLVFTAKKDQTKLGTPLNYGLAYALIAASAIIIAYALIWKPGVWIVLLSLSPIGFIVGYGVRAYISGKQTSKRQWFYEHMGTFITCGIGFHTAFTVFGVNRLFDLGLEGPFAVLPWLAPTIIGIPALRIWESYYRKKFNDPKKPVAKAVAAA
ncbi:MAG: hypothetical protein COB37_07445 [Kordiimonadales bacterium]|nr:MAG: hypothetical protein COB37_07445 [Kordiimonadales bacterium]